jgi:hypothetical protein
MTANVKFVNSIITNTLTIDSLTLLRERLRLDEDFLEELLRLQVKRPAISNIVLEFMRDAIVEYVLEHDKLEWLMDEIRSYNINDFHTSILKQVQSLTYPMSEKLETFVDCYAL